MNKKKFIPYLVLLFIGILSCKAQETKNNIAILSGTIHAKGIDSVVLVNRVTKYKKNIAVNNGAFSDSITINKARNFVLEAGKNRYTLYLQKGYNLNVTIDKDLTNRSISFSGVGAEVNSYYKDKAIFMKESDDVKSFYDMKTLAKYSETTCKATANKIKDSMYAILKNARLNDENFSAFEKENLFWSHTFNKAMYHYYKEGEAYKDTTKTYTPSPGFLPQEFLNSKFDNEDLFINSDKYNFLASTNYSRAFSFNAYKKPHGNEKIRVIDSLCNTMRFTYLKDQFLASVGSLLSGVKDQKIGKTYFDYFTSKLSHAGYKKEYVSFYRNIQEQIKEKEKLIGTPSPKFIDYENFAGGTTSLDDLKGKYVYIDVWATWCGPCKQQIPFLKEVEKKYHNKNIEFVSISVDRKSAYDAWRTMVTEKELTGIQLIADKDFQSQFVKDYGVTGIPRFILIDPEGKIVNVQAPRPSDPKLIELFDSLKL